MKILRALDAGFTAFVNTLSPFDFPLLGDYVADSLEDSSTGRDSASAAGVEESPGGDATPTSPPGHLTSNDLTDAAAAALYWQRCFYGPNGSGWKYWGRLADRLADAATELST